MNIKEILESKTFVRQGSKASEPKAYLEPVLEAFDKLNGKVSARVEKAVQNANDDETINTSFGRVLIEAEFSKFAIPELDTTHKVGFIYALDKNIPEFVTYAGQEIFACTNLCVSSDEHVHSFKDNHTHAQKQIQTYLEDLDRQRNEIIAFHNKLQAISLSVKELDTTIGHLLRLGLRRHKKIGQTAILHGHKQMLSTGTLYSVAEEDETDMWNVYNSITDFYSKKFKNDKYLYERPIKTIDLSRCFRNLISGLN